jgi:uridine kinase
VAITGIDGSGKGFLSALLSRELEAGGARVALINIDPWLNLPEKRFSAIDPARHFYESGIRFTEAFEQLILPLRKKRTHTVQAEIADATYASTFRRHTYAFTDVDIILVDGIFLLKRELRDHFDLSIWIDCSFKTALERALARGQEHLPPEQVIGDYQTIYFPAQRIHMEEDQPREFATAKLINDPRLESPSTTG